MKWAGQVTCTWEMWNAHNIFVRIP